MGREPAKYKRFTVSHNFFITSMQVAKEHESLTKLCIHCSSTEAEVHMSMNNVIYINEIHG